MKSSVRIALVGVLAAGAVAAVAQATTVKEPPAAAHGTPAPAPAATSHDAPAASAPTTQTAATPPATAGHGGPAWTYAGTTGPERWASLSRDFELCGVGAMQSPIDMSQFNGASVAPIAFDYKLSPLEIVHNGHTVQVNYAAGSSITVEGQRVNWFVLRQPVSISMAQIKRFAAAVGENARPVQPVNQRFVLAPLAGQ